MLNASKKFEASLKIDMNKAYDRVDWNFLKAVVTKMGFSDTTVSFSIVLNGKPGRFFKPSCGLRQGDPLSPYLFLIICEVLFLCLSKSISYGDIKGIKLSRRGPILSHLFFTDDSLFFIRVDEENCKKLKYLLDKYCGASGQHINLEKSSIVFSANTPHEEKLRVYEAFGIPYVNQPRTYLGLPTHWGRSKKSVLSYVRERVQKKIEGWKASSFSL